MSSSFTSAAQSTASHRRVVYSSKYIQTFNEKEIYGWADDADDNDATVEIAQHTDNVANFNTTVAYSLQRHVRCKYLWRMELVECACAHVANINVGEKNVIWTLNGIIENKNGKRRKKSTQTNKQLKQCAKWCECRFSHSHTFGSHTMSNRCFVK